MDLVQNKDFLESLSYLVAILSGFFGSIYFLNKCYIRYNKRVDEAFTGMWLNEGCINCRDEFSHSIVLSLESIKKNLIGSIAVTNFQDNSKLNALSIIGKRIF